MNNHKSIQILRGAESYDPTTSEEILLDGQPFYSKKTKQLYIGDGVTPIKNLNGTYIGLSLSFLDEKLEPYQEKSGDNLNTESKEIVGSINELADIKLNKYLGADDTSNLIYSRLEDGENGIIKGSYDPSDNAIPIYSLGGFLKTSSPKNGTDCANKDYVDNKFNGANKAVSFTSYSGMIGTLSTLPKTAYSVGQNIMIVTLSVPDLWVSDVAEESATYTYVSDSDFVNELNTNGSVQVGYFKLSALETQKVDLTEYAKINAVKLEDGSYSITLIKEG